MAANVSVSGMPREMGGLKESISAFRKHHHEVGGALLNISGVGTVEGKPVDKDEPRMTYDPKNHPFPKMIYHAEHGELVVNDQHELEEALRQKYRLEPYLKPQVALADPKAEKLATDAKIKAQEGTINAQNDMLLKMQARLEALENSASEPKKK